MSDLEVWHQHDLTSNYEFLQFSGALVSFYEFFGALRWYSWISLILKINAQIFASELS
ncbi:hypothetical protein [Candidatus Borrarchaeum sp.]|uniref:hypothetical protein n=1 Tax=Candidatus Borrarchaeum sp. TaxID=2846742 RepID=UPI00257C66DF|nr:hypothetical protein [Candidatus Borrarchaeum sp.]